MPIIGSVESKSIRGRVIHVAIIVLLSIGAVTMVYPFVIMLSGSFRSEVDENDLNLIPRFWTDDTDLYRKFLETKYNQDIDRLNRAHHQRYFSFRNVAPPDPAVGNEVIRLLSDVIGRDELPYHWQSLGGIYGIRTVPEKLRDLRNRLAEHYGGDLEAFISDFGSPVNSWHSVVLPVPDWVNQRYDHPGGELFDIYLQMLAESDASDRELVSISGYFMQSVIYPVYGRNDTAEYNRHHVQPIDDYSDFRLPMKVPGEDQPQLRREWVEFVTKELHPSFIVVDGANQEQYDSFLYHTMSISRSEPLPDGSLWLHGPQLLAYKEFLTDQPIDRLRLVGPEYHFGQKVMPAAVAAMEYEYVRKHAGALRWAYTVRNYINVLDELIFQGRALLNTTIFCAMAIVLAMLVNPMAAYAMSRFKMVSTYKILLFLMATMAFPPMVTLIPQFIMLRNLGLFNTFIALVMPLLVNGYMIFLLKGFFDSLPNELYEAARIDGASEIRMFWQITMALSKPILAVLALGTFTSAYTMFLYPLLVAPDTDMWLISVWLFQYQQRSSSAGVYASIIIASIPTMVIFLFAQRTIMRGIVVPIEK